ENRPGVSNLLTILAAATGRTPAEVAAGYTQYGPLKANTGEAVVEMLRPVQERYAALQADPAELARLLAVGADKAHEVASKTLARSREAMGFLWRGCRETVLRRAVGRSQQREEVRWGVSRAADERDRDRVAAGGAELGRADRLVTGVAGHPALAPPGAVAARDR